MERERKKNVKISFHNCIVCKRNAEESGRNVQVAEDSADRNVIIIIIIHEKNPSLSARSHSSSPTSLLFSRRIAPRSSPRANVHVSRAKIDRSSSSSLLSLVLVVTRKRIEGDYFHPILSLFLLPLLVLSYFSVCVCVCGVWCSLPCRRRLIRAGSYNPLVDSRGRGNGCGGAPYFDRFRAGNRWPAQNPLAVSRQISLILRRVLSLLQRPFQLVHQTVVKLVQGVGAPGFRWGRAGALARALQRVLGRPRGRPREMAGRERDRTMSGRCQEVRSR